MSTPSRWVELTVSWELPEGYEEDWRKDQSLDDLVDHISTTPVLGGTTPTIVGSLEYSDD